MRRKQQSASMRKSRGAREKEKMAGIIGGMVTANDPLAWEAKIASCVERWVTASHLSFQMPAMEGP